MVDAKQMLASISTKTHNVLSHPKCYNLQKIIFLYSITKICCQFQNTSDHSDIIVTLISECLT